MKTYEETLLLVEIATEANERFGHRQDKDRMVRSTLDFARDLIAKNPAVTDFIGEIAIASSRAQSHRIYVVSPRQSRGLQIAGPQWTGNLRFDSIVENGSFY